METLTDWLKRQPQILNSSLLPQFDWSTDLAASRREDNRVLKADLRLLMLERDGAPNPIVIRVSAHGRMPIIRPEEVGTWIEAMQVLSPRYAAPKPERIATDATMPDPVVGSRIPAVQLIRAHDAISKAHAADHEALPQAERQRLWQEVFKTSYLFATYPVSDDTLTKIFSAHGTETARSPIARYYGWYIQSQKKLDGDVPTDETRARALALMREHADLPDLKLRHLLNEKMAIHPLHQSAVARLLRDFRGGEAAPAEEAANDMQM